MTKQKESVMIGSWIKTTKNLVLELQLLQDSNLW